MSETKHEFAYVAEHGTKRGTVFGTCTCGWSGPARRSEEKAKGDVVLHACQIDTLQDLQSFRNSSRVEA